MNKFVFIVLYALFGLITFASDHINGDQVRTVLDLSNIKIPSPRPHMVEIAEPQAYYTVSTATLSIELDPVYYSQYTIIIQSDYASLDYIVTSPVVNIPVGSLDSVVDIYIESDDCGCYYGTLNQADYGKSP